MAGIINYVIGGKTARWSSVWCRDQTRENSTSIVDSDHVHTTLKNRPDAILAPLLQEVRRVGTEDFGWSPTAGALGST